MVWIVDKLAFWECRPEGAVIDEAPEPTNVSPSLMFFFCNKDMGGCQNYCPLVGPLCTRCRVILRTQKGTIISTTTHILVIRPKNWNCFVKFTYEEALRTSGFFWFPVCM